MTSCRGKTKNEGLFKSEIKIEEQKEGKEMGFLSHRVEACDLEAGDHIYTWRKAFVYSHHGIYVGGNKVVHFTNDQILCSSASSFSTLFSSSLSSYSKIPEFCLDYPDCCLSNCGSGVIISCLNCFLGNGSLHRFQYGVSRLEYLAKIRSGTCTTAESDPPKIVIHRAMYLLQNGFGSYDLLQNNCEDFALYCKTGLLVCGREGYGGSGQTSSLLSAPLAVVEQFAQNLLNPFSSGFAAKTVAISSSIYSPLATVRSLARQLTDTNPVVLSLTIASIYVRCKFHADIGLRDDVTKLEVEDVSSVIAKKLVQKDVLSLLD